jgi:O-antigen/teichoic acid export membrane protein
MPGADSMTKPFALYTATWVAACLVAGYLMARHHATLELFHARYRRFLLQDWKVVSFVVASTGLTLVAPYADDITWDYVDALVMCVLTFVTAPWAVGTSYRVLKRRTAWVNGYVAACVWLFSASWFYDLYIVLRDGAYSPYWLPNLFLSSLLYLTAGLLWSLEWRHERGVVFQFVEAHWPERDAERNFRKILPYTVPFVIVAGAVILPFLL